MTPDRTVDAEGVGGVTLLTLSQFYAELRKATGDNQTAWADAHGLSVSYVNDVLHARKDPGPRIIAALGLRRVPMFSRVAKGMS